jgi:hypothetical protein
MKSKSITTDKIPSQNQRNLKELIQVKCHIDQKDHLKYY